MGGCIGRHRGSGGINNSSDNLSRPNSGKIGTGHKLPRLQLYDVPSRFYWKKGILNIPLNKQCIKMFDQL